MTKSQLREIIRNLVKETMNNPAPSKPKISPTIAPGKPGTGKPKPRRPLGNPEVKPKPKAEGIVDKIAKRYTDLKK